MENDKHKIIFAHGKCISEDVLIAYANNTLSAKEKHVVEKHTLGCDMCADALEGIMMMKDPSQLKGIVESLNKKISGASGTERKPIILWMDTRVRVAIAAGLALLIGFYFLFDHSLNGPENNKTVSDNSIKQKEQTVDSSKLSFEENAKTDSTANFHQTVSKGKEDDSKSDLQRLIKEGENANNGSGGPGRNTTAHANDPNASGGDRLKNESAPNEVKTNNVPPAPPKDSQNGSTGFNDISTLDKSQTEDQSKKTPLQDGKVTDKDKREKKSADDGQIVLGQSTTVTTGTNQPVNTTVNLEKVTSNYSGDAKTDAPKKEEKEKTISKESRKDKKKSTEYPETQKQPDEKSNKGGKDNSESTGAPQSTTVVTGGTSGNVSPNMVPQNKRTEQEITLSNNKQVSDDEDLYSKADTLKFRAAMMDSVSKLSELSSGEKKYTQKDYSGAVVIFAKTLETKPTDREALYKLGDSYLQLNKPDLAIVQFDKLIAMGKGTYYDAARYDKSIALVKQNKNAEAKKLLMEIEQTSTEYKSRAKVELDKVK